MDRKNHITFIFSDLFGLLIIWLGYSDLQEIQSKIAAQTDMISYGNRMGFFIVGVGLPILHLITLLGIFWPDLIKKYSVVGNISIVILLFTLIVGGVAGSYWLESQVKNAGYVYCRRAGWGGVVSKTLVYTKDMKICEDLIEEKRRKHRRPPKNQVYYPSQLH